MTSPYRIERDRGIKDSSKQLAMLQERWPLAFPLKLDDVRPLAEGASREIAAAMGWSLPYTLGVLGSWKLAAFYCRAILAHDQRITLDGTPAETVNAEAKDLASKRLAELTSRRAPKLERDRGTKDSSKQLVVLQEKWPLAFPLKLIDVRPLAQGASRQIATAMDWSMPYTLGVLGGWTSAAFYCRAVLAHDQCITLDGALAGPVDTEAKDSATKRLAEIMGRKAANKPGPKPAVTTAEQAPKQAVTAPEPVLEKPPEKPKPAAETAKPRKGAAAAKPVAKPKPAAAKPAPTPAVETVPETPEQLRARVRAALLRRSA